MNYLHVKILNVLVSCSWNIGLFRSDYGVNLYMYKGIKVIFSFPHVKAYPFPHCQTNYNCGVFRRIVRHLTLIGLHTNRLFRPY